MKKSLVTILIIATLFVPFVPTVWAADILNDYSTGLNSYWEMEQTAGNSALDSHGSTDLTDNGTVGSATGLQGNAADLESGTPSYFSSGSTADVSIDTSFTVTAAIKLESDTGTLQTIVQKGVSNNYEYQLFIVPVTGTNKYDLRLDNSGSPTQTEALQSDADTTLTPGTWYCLAFVYDTSVPEARFYVDGSQLGNDISGTYTSLNDGSSTFYLGRWRGAALEFDGLIDEVGFYAAAVSASDISDICNSGSYVPYEDAGGGGGGGTPAPEVFVPHMLLAPPKHFHA